MTASIIEALDGPFAPWFPGSSWSAWRAVLKAAFALSMSEDDLAIFADLAGGREPPSKRVKEIVVIAGRRGGKDSIASAVAAWIGAIEQAHIGLLRPGERQACCSWRWIASRRASSIATSKAILRRSPN
jgi:hypothetical protein